MLEICAIFQKITFSFYFNLIPKRTEATVWVTRSERLFESKLRLRDAPITRGFILEYLRYLIERIFKYLIKKITKYLIFNHGKKMI